MPKRSLKLEAGSLGFLFEQHPQPMWLLDRDTLEFLDVNQAALELYGFSRDEFLKMGLSEIRVAEEGERAAEGAAAASASQRRHRLKNGRVIPVDVVDRQLDYGGRHAVLAMITDLTQRKMLEDQLRQAQKLETVGMLAGGIAHDFNNLLTIITGYSQLLLNAMKTEEPNRSAAEQILKASDRAAGLTRQLLAFSRCQILQPKVLDLNVLVAGMGTMLRRLIGEDLDLRLVMRPDLGWVNADPGQLEQVVMNLALNARDAMPQGGTLTIETANVELDEEYTATHVGIRPGAYVMLAVSDNGTGMDPDVRAHVFEPFFTTKGQGKGTGLGLSTVYGIIKQGGGAVDLHSEPGRGTSVKVYLPRIDQKAKVEADDLTEEAGPGTETILVVEDEEMVRTLVRETLVREGYTVLDASGPEQAKQICESYGGTIDLMITDVVMPKRSGHDLAEEMVRQRPEMKVLYMSGYTEHAIQHTGVRTEEMPFLQKPFTPSVLAHKVRDALERSGGATHHAGN